MAIVVRIGDEKKRVTVRGACRITWRRDGSSEFAFSVHPSVTVNPFELVEVKEDGVRVFIGRLQAPVYDEGKGVLLCRAVDFKTLLGDLALVAHTTDGPTGRHGRVKFTAANYATVPAVIKAMVTQAWNTDGTDDNQELLSDVVPAEYVGQWVGEAGLALWDALPTTDISPYTVMFDGDTVGRALTTLVGKYYLGWGWWVDPADVMIKPYESYSDTASAFHQVHLGDDRAWVNGISASLDGVYTRVIVESPSLACTNIDPDTAGAAAFATSDVFVGHEKETWVVDEPLLTITKVSINGIDGETGKYQKETNVSESLSGYIGESTHTWTTKQGKYSKDTRVRKCCPSAGFSGEAYDEYGLKRTLRIQDDSFGVLLEVGADGTITTESRVAAQQKFADDIHGVVSRLRWNGTMKVKMDGRINPLQRVRVLKHDRFGTIDFVPASIEWDMHTGMRTYTLGDSKIAPMAELKLKQELAWKKKGAAGKRWEPGMPQRLTR